MTVPTNSLLTDGALSQPSGFRPEIQGLRGVAVLLVVLFHAGGILPGGFVGVDVFFVISGYLIGGILLRDMMKPKGLSVGIFFARRVRRILPAMAVATSVTVGLSVFFASLTQSLVPAGKTGVAGSLFVANVHLYRAAGYFAPESERNPLLHLWSLSVEEQFYVGLPVVVVAAAWFGRRRSIDPLRALIVLLALIAVGSFGLSVLFVTATEPVLGFDQPQRLAFYAPVTRAWQFLAGVLLAVWVLARRDERRSPTWWPMWVGLAALATASVTFGPATLFPGVAALLPVTGALMLLGSAAASEAAKGNASTVEGLLSSWPLTTLGDLSYSWYLWHWPAIVFTDRAFPGNRPLMLAAALASLVPAWLSYRFIEARFRYDETIVGRRALGLAVACIAFPVVLSLGVLRLSDAALDRLSEVEALDALFDAERELQATSSIQPVSDERPRDIVLVGDSHAGALHSGLALRLRDADVIYEPLIQQGCIFLMHAYSEPHCREWQRQVLQHLQQNEARAVVLHGYSTGAFTGVRRGAQRPPKMFLPDGSPVLDSMEALRLFEREMAELVDELAQEGRTIVLLAPVPDFSESLIDRITAWRALRGASIESLSIQRIPLHVAEERISPILRILDRVALDRPDVIVIESAPSICRPDCVQLEGKTLLYVDLDHLAPEGALRLADDLLKTLEMNHSG